MIEVTDRVVLKKVPVWRRVMIAPAFFMFVLRITHNARASMHLTWRMVRF